MLVAVGTTLSRICLRTHLYKPWNSSLHTTWAKAQAATDLHQAIQLRPAKPLVRGHPAAHLHTVQGFKVVALLRCLSRPL